MSWRKKLLFASITVPLLLFAALKVLETALGLMAKGEKPPANNSRTITWGIPVRTNKLGFRDRQPKIPKPAGVFRIAVLGDSLTWGAGLEESQRYTNQLEGLLRSSSRNVEVLNMGLPGAATTLERDFLLKNVDALAPDLVVVGWCLNDPQPRDQDWSIEGEEWKSTRWKIECRFDDVGLRRVGELVAARLPRAIGAVPDWTEALDRTYAPDSSEWQAFTAALTDIKAACDRAGAHAPLYALLLQNDGDYGKPDAYLSKILEWSHLSAEAAEKCGFQTVSMEAAFKAEGYRKRWVNPWDGHPDAQCNRIYAEELAKAIAPIIRAQPGP